MPIQIDNTNSGLVTLKGPASSTGSMKFPAANGTSSQILTTDGSGVMSWVVLSAPSVAGFTYSSANRSFIASGGTTNQVAAIVAKGSGGFLVNLPDATATGGNARGLSSVDLQVARASAANVASGTRSIVAGGYNNKASSTSAITVGGYQNSAGSASSMMLGGRYLASTVSGGSESGQIQIGCNNSTASNTLSGSNSVVIGGTRSLNLTVSSGYGFAMPGFSNSTIGSFLQSNYTYTTGEYQLGGVTTSSTTKELTMNAATASSSNRLNPGSSATMRGEAVARASNGTTKTWRFVYAIAAGVQQGTTTVLYSDTGTSSWDLAITATSGSVFFNATGDAALTVRWLVRAVLN